MNTKERAQAVCEEIGYVFSLVDEKQIEEFTDILIRKFQEKRKIFVMAAGRTNLIMRCFAMRLMQIGFEVYVVFDINTPAIRKGDLLIACSGSGKTDTVLNIVSKAAKQGADVISIVGNSECPLAEMSQHYLVIPTGSFRNKLETNGGEFEQPLFILCDCIGVELLIKMKLIDKIESIDDYIKIRHANLQ